MMSSSGHGLTLTKKRLREIADWCEDHITIYDADEHVSFPLRWNRIQNDLLDNSLALRLHEVIDATIKARQMGSTVGLLAIVIGLLKYVPGICITWVNLDDTRAKTVRRKFRHLLISAQNSPGSGFPDVRLDSEQEFVLSNGSALVWEEAGGSPQTSGRAGRGDTIHLAIFCEMSTWEYPEKTLGAIIPAIKSTKGAIIIDSTPPEFEGDGEEYLRYVRAIRDGRVPGRLFFWPWWFRYGYAAETCATPPFSSRERWLMREHGVDLYQLQWRRDTIAQPSVGPIFRYVYPETLDEALSPKGSAAFSADVVERLALRAAADDWPEHLLPIEVEELFPSSWESQRYDPLTDDRVCRIWRAPASPEPVTEPTTARGFASWMRARRKDAAVGHAYTIGVDSSDGGPKSDRQCAAVIDSEGEICALLRCRLAPIHFAAAVQRLAIIYGARVVVETNARSGALVSRYLTETIGEETIETTGAHPVLRQSLAGVEDFSTNAKTRPEVEEQFLTMLDGLVDVPCDWVFSEMLQWDLEKRKARAGSEDDVLDALGIAWVARARALRRARERKPRLKATTRRMRTAF